jgi:diadenosine tetraphosphate (Ap4A) HIT family hydrolase
MDTQCSLCAGPLAPILRSTKHWDLVLNRNQNPLGKCFLSVRRHAESITELSTAEWDELRGETKAARAALDAAFAPDHFNYLFLQNQDRHVHMHIVPRYASARSFEGESFNDPDYPDHYRVPAPQRRLSAKVVEKLAARLRTALDYPAQGQTREKPSVHADRGGP